MNDAAGLPRYPYPVLLPDSGGFEEAIGRARRRRRRQVYEATAMLSVVALFAGSFALSRPGVDGPAELDTADTAEAERGPRPGRLGPVPGATSSTAPGGQPQPTPTGGGGSGRPVRPGTAGAPPSVPAKQPDPARPPVGQQPPRGYSVKYDAVRRTETFGTECRTAATEQWCLFAEVKTEGPNRYLLTTIVCRGIDATDTELTFRNAQYVDYQILLKGQVRWTWSYGQQFDGGERTLPVDPGECVAWDVRWDADDEQGRLLVPSSTAGSYTLRVRSAATELGARTAAKDFSVE